MYLLRKHKEYKRVFLNFYCVYSYYEICWSNSFFATNIFLLINNENEDKD